MFYPIPGETVQKVCWRCRKQGVRQTHCECRHSYYFFRSMAFAEFSHPCGLVALGKPYSLGVADQGDVGEFRHRSVQNIVQMYLGSSGKKEIRTANHFCNSHHGIVNNDCKLIRPGTVGSLKYEISAVLPKVDFLHSVGAVLEDDFGVGHHNSR